MVGPRIFIAPRVWTSATSLTERAVAGVLERVGVHRVDAGAVAGQRDQLRSTLERLDRGGAVGFLCSEGEHGAHR